MGIGQFDTLPVNMRNLTLDNAKENLEFKIALQIQCVDQSVIDE